MLWVFAGLTDEVRMQARLCGRLDEISYFFYLISGFCCHLLLKNLGNAFISGEASQNGSSAHGSQNGGPNTPQPMVNQTMAIMPISAAASSGAVSGPTTNLNIGMDYWGSPASSNMPAIRGKVPPTTVTGGIVTAGSRDSVQSQLWFQVNIVDFTLN